MILEKEYLTEEERFSVMRMIFGGHVNEYDYHCVGLNEEFLTGFLLYADYINIRRVENFGFFNDTSTMVFKSIPISLNIVAEKKLRFNKTSVDPS
jgi:predicted SAM-dependent methyltransferase